MIYHVFTFIERYVVCGCIILFVLTLSEIFDLCNVGVPSVLLKPTHSFAQFTVEQVKPAKISI